METNRPTFLQSKRWLERVMPTPFTCGIRGVLTCEVSSTLPLLSPSQACSLLFCPV